MNRGYAPDEEQNGVKEVVLQNGGDITLLFFVD